MSCRTLRVRLWQVLRTESGGVKYKLLVTHLFHGTTRSEARELEKTHRSVDSFYAAGMGPKARRCVFEGMKLRVHADWIC